MSEEEAPRDPSTYTEEEKAMIEKYGRLPKKPDLIKKRNDRLKGGKARFDSADWELKKKRIMELRTNLIRKMITEFSQCL